MKIETLLGINSDNAVELLEKIVKYNEKKVKFGAKVLTTEDMIKMYDPNQHDVHDPTKRPDKQIEVPAPDWTEQNQLMMPDTVYANRSSMPYQKLIVQTANAFLTGNPMDFIVNPADDKEKTLLAAVKRVLDNNKMDYLNAQIGELMGSESHCALLWYWVDNSANPDADNDFEGIAINTNGLTLRAKVLAKSLGDDLYPIYDSIGNMIGFLRVYTEIEDDETKTKVSELHTDKVIFVIRQNSGQDQPTVDPITNPAGKIMIIYFVQPQPEYLDVQPNITRSEKMLSNTGDSNDYYASPTTVVNGDIVGFSKKGETGKVLQVGRHASVTLLEAKNGVESVKFEKDTQKEIIFDGTFTPNISLESMKGVGVFSGIALKLLFFAPALKVKNKLPTYGQSQQRNINLIKAVLAKFDTSFKLASRMVIKPKIDAYMPANIEEALQNLSLATGNQPIMSQETAVRLNPLVENPDDEITKVKKDNEAKLGSELAA